MADTETMIIIGAGIAGVHAAESLRKEGHQGRIILLDSDTQMPYDRPPLSKEWMTGGKDDESILLRDASVYENLDIDLKLGAEVTNIDPVHKTLSTQDGSSYQWDKLMLATGSQLRTLSIDGDDLEGIFYLRKMADAQAIKYYIQNVQQAVIIGAGFIGAEMASSLRQLGIEVTIVERSSYPMENIVGRDVSQYFLALHRQNGVNVLTDDSIVQFNGETAVTEAITAKGKHIPCQAVMLSVGVVPNTGVSHPDLEVSGGYAVNQYGETSISDIYAAGDCTSWPYQGTPVHIEHWDHAVNHAKAVSKNMINPQSSPYAYIPYFWSEQYDHRFQYFGHAKTWAKTIVRKSEDTSAFTCFYLDEQNRPQAALISNQAKNALPARKMIKKQSPVNPEDLADGSVSLKKMQRALA